MRLLNWMTIFSLLSSVIFASEVYVNTPDGEAFVLDVDPNQTLGELENQIAALTEDSSFVVAVPSTKEGVTSASSQGGYLGFPRPYEEEVKAPERNDIRFIVTTLANKSLISIALIKGDLEAAGDRIEHLHPLRFLMTVFMDEELKVAIRNIRGRGWVWNQFAGGLKASLATETNIGNMKDEFVHHFAGTLEVDSTKIVPFVHSQNWDGLIDALIREVPRKGDFDRYDN